LAAPQRFNGDAGKPRQRATKLRIAGGHARA
jgi:hypothetical protein